MRVSTGFLLLSTGAAFQKKMLTEIASEGEAWYSPHRLKSDCFQLRPVTTAVEKRALRAQRDFNSMTASLRATRQMDAEEVRVRYDATLLESNKGPGAGIGGIVPFKTVLKDGFSMQRCFKDEMYYHGDKFHHNKHDYQIGGRSNVSIVHYTEHVAKEDRKEMSPEECFRFCRTVPDMFNFGVLNGRECYCSPWSESMAGDSSTCDAPCPGDPKQMCGGRSKSSIYEMHMCANTEEDLLKTADAMETAMSDLNGATKELRNAANQGQKESEELQLMLGIMGDHAASNNFQASKIEAGVILRLVKEADTILEEMEGLHAGLGDLMSSTTTSTNLLRLLQEPDWTSVEVVEKAEKLTGSMTVMIKASKDLVKRMHQKFSFQRLVGTNQGAKSALNRSHQYYDAYYFVNQDSPMGAAWSRDKSTCSGKLVSEPIFQLTLDECAYACDEAADLGCTSFSWISKGAGMCFLFSQVEKVTQYDMCAKALEGECAPSPVKSQDEETTTLPPPSLAQVHAKTQSTPFPFKVKSLEPNATLFKESVTGMCTSVYGCPGMPAEEVVSDCSLMETYSCRGDRIRNPKIEEKDDGTLAMSFSGSVPSGTRANSCAVNTDYCAGCKKYSTCAGPYLETEEVEIKKGDVASYTWTSSGATDSYEVFVGLYSATCGLVDYQFQRGDKQEWQTFELFSPKTDKYYMKFMLGSYDGTGGGAVGADMQVRDVKQTKATVPRDLGVEAKCMVKLSEYNGLSLKPDKSGKCKHCLKDATKRCLKPDGSFPTPKLYDEKFGDGAEDSESTTLSPE